MTTYFSHDHQTNRDGKPLEHLNIEARHQEGGLSFYDYTTRARGLSVSFRALDIEHVNDMTSRSFMMFGGEIAMSFHVATLARRNAKKGAALAAFVAANLEELIPLAMAENWQEVQNCLNKFALSDFAARKLESVA